jgi:enterochelin esterase family protein
MNVLQAPLDDRAGADIAARLRAALPREARLDRGHAWSEGELVGFLLDAPAATAAKPPRVSGMINHGRGVDLLPVGQSGLWVRVEEVPADTRFAYAFELNGERKASGVIEMSDWSYPPESQRQPGRSYGRYEPLQFESQVFQNERTGWIYIPSAYDDTTPAALLVVQDGDAYKGESIGAVVDNLIAAGQIPVTLVIGLNPGKNPDGSSNRSVEYDTLSDRYASFLEREVLPRVREKYKIKPDASDHVIMGASSGGICAFTAAWHRPDLFGKVISQIGSFTNIRGGDAYPELIRAAEPRPIRVVLTIGTNDLINRFGDWWQANQAMQNALKDKGYDVFLHTDRGFHAFWTCGRQLPLVLRKIWEQPAPAKP